MVMTQEDNYMEHGNYEAKPGARDTQNNLNRTLKSRHMSMIAVGGTIGTGLFVASGGVLSEAGPAGALVAYSLMGLIVFFVMTSLAEMSTFIPVAGSFNSFADRFVDPAFGFAVGYNYWYSWITAAATDLVAAGIIMEFWLPNVNTVVWSFALMAIIIFLNLFGAKLYGEAEFWLALIKVLAIVIFIIIGILVASGIVGGTKYGFSNWKIEG
ncbi:Lysine-specific permease, partial [Smittium culicis]